MKKMKAIIKVNNNIQNVADIVSWWWGAVWWEQWRGWSLVTAGVVEAGYTRNTGVHHHCWPSLLLHPHWLTQHTHHHSQDIVVENTVCPTLCSHTGTHCIEEWSVRVRWPVLEWESVWSAQMCWCHELSLSCSVTLEQWRRSAVTWSRDSGTWVTRDHVPWTRVDWSRWTRCQSRGAAACPSSPASTRTRLWRVLMTVESWRTSAPVLAVEEAGPRRFLCWDLSGVWGTLTAPLSDEGESVMEESEDVEEW